MGKVTIESLGYRPKPIDPDFLTKYPETGTHHNHKVYAEGVQRYDEDGKPYPTKLGIHGTMVAVDFEACIADGACMDACPVQVFEWLLNPGKMGTGQDLDLSDKPELKVRVRQIRPNTRIRLHLLPCMRKRLPHARYQNHTDVSQA